MATIEFTHTQLETIREASARLRDLRPSIEEVWQATANTRLTYNDAPKPCFDNDDDYERWGDLTGFKSLTETAYQLAVLLAEVALTRVE